MFQIETKRIALRPFTPADAETVELLAGDWEVAKTLALVPHPYPKGGAAKWIDTHRELARTGEEYVFAITKKPKGELMGAVSLRKKPERFGNVGYWLGQRYWDKGYATEAVQCIAAVAFDWLNRADVTASALADNAASCRVLEKSRFAEVGRKEMQHRQESGLRTFRMFRLTREDWEAARGTLKTKR